MNFSVILKDWPLFVTPEPLLELAVELAAADRTNF